MLSVKKLKVWLRLFSVAWEWEKLEVDVRHTPPSQQKTFEPDGAAPAELFRPLTNRRTSGADGYFDLI